jgi:hypothetical protein
VRTAYRSLIYGSETIMASSTAFPFSGFLHLLEAPAESAHSSADMSMQAVLRGVMSSEDGASTPLAHSLVALLKARQAMYASVAATDRVADELRRYQKFVRPGQPSAHIVQLRQQQAATRQASSQSRQRFNHAATVFVREARIEVPPRVSLEAFVIRWIELNIPTDAATS